MPKMTVPTLLGMLDGAEGSETDEYAKFAARWAHYSERNQRLLWLQRPAATRLHTFRGWVAEGRRVRKGERAIWLLAPHTRDVPETERNPDGKVVLRVRPIALFDASQTDAVE
jgi:hypothetical protein